MPAPTTIAETFHALDRDLERIDPRPDAADYTSGVEVYQRPLMSPLGVQSGLFRIGQRVADILLHAGQDGRELPTRVDPKFLLTKRVLLAARHANLTPDTVQSQQDGGCTEAELKFAQDFADFDDSQQYYGRAGLLLQDVRGRSIAYQKVYGDPTAYAWRSGWMETKQGEQYVYANTLIVPVWDTDPGHGPHRDMAQNRAVKVRSAVPYDIRFLRFNVASMPACLQWPITRAGMLKHSSYTWEEVDMARNMNSRLVGGWARLMGRTAISY